MSLLIDTINEDTNEGGQEFTVDFCNAVGKPPIANHPFKLVMKFSTSEGGLLQLDNIGLIKKSRVNFCIDTSIM